MSYTSTDMATWLVLYIVKHLLWRDQGVRVVRYAATDMGFGVRDV